MTAKPEEGKPEKTKPDCYECEWRGKVAGSAHSSCNHPSIKEAKDSPMGGLMATFASVQRVPPVGVSSNELNIKGNSHGIENGWFNFPWNFDPLW